MFSNIRTNFNKLKAKVAKQALKKDHKKHVEEEQVIQQNLSNNKSVVCSPVSIDTNPSNGIGTFNLLNGDKIRVPMMNQWHQHFEYRTSKSYQVLKMPYKISNNDDDKTKEFSMYVFLPRKQNGLHNLVNKINIDDAKLFTKFKFVEITRLSIPQFNVEWDTLEEHMKQLGLLLSFEETCKDFSVMADVTEPIYVSDISQKCFVETNERGTVAAAITRMRYACGAARITKPPPPPVNFVVDHPFMYVIREDVSGVVRFFGVVLDPR